jgi:hypothetical protein
MIPEDFAGMPIAQMRRYADLARCGDATLVERMNLLTEHELNVQAKSPCCRRSKSIYGKRSTGTASSCPLLPADAAVG